MGEYRVRLVEAKSYATRYNAPRVANSVGVATCARRRESKMLDPKIDEARVAAVAVQFLRTPFPLGEHIL